MRHKLLYKAVGLYLKARNRLLKPTTIGVRAVVVNGDGQVLLVRHAHGTQWFLPGGGVDKGETLLQALRRELTEELGLAFHGLPDLLGTYTNQYEHKRDFISVFILKAFTMHPQKNAEIDTWSFFAPDDLPPETSPGTKRRIDEFSRKKGIDFLW